MIFGLIVIALEAVEKLLSANEILKWNIIKRLIAWEIRKSTLLYYYFCYYFTNFSYFSPIRYFFLFLILKYEKIKGLNRQINFFMPET